MFDRYLFLGPKYQTLRRSLDIYIISKIKWDLTNGPLSKLLELSNGDFLDYAGSDLYWLQLQLHYCWWKKSCTLH